MKPIAKYLGLALAGAAICAAVYGYFNSYQQTTQHGGAQQQIEHEQVQSQAGLEQALKKLQNRGLYNTPERQRCILFDTETVDQDRKDQLSIDLVVRELHDPEKNCAGDPNVAPVLARYRVALASADIGLYNAAEDEYQVLSDCDVLAYQAFAEPKRYTVAVAEHMQVYQAGRSHFHSAPDLSCKLPQKFVVQGDKLRADYQFQDFTRVSYTHPKTSEVSFGWILSRDLIAASKTQP